LITDELGSIQLWSQEDIYFKIEGLKRTVGSILQKRPDLLENHKSLLNITTDYLSIDKARFLNVITQCISDTNGNLSDKTAFKKSTNLSVYRSLMTVNRWETPERLHVFKAAQEITNPVHALDFENALLIALTAELYAFKFLQPLKMFEHLSIKDFNKARIIANFTEQLPNNAAIAYKPKFPTNAEWKEAKDDYSSLIAAKGNGSFELPVRHTWYNRVYQKKLAATDIAGKDCVVLQVWDIPDNEQIALNTTDYIRLYRARVGYVKTVNNPNGQEKAHFYLSPKTGVVTLSINLNLFRRLNPELVAAESAGKISFTSLNNRQTRAIWLPGGLEHYILYFAPRRGINHFVEERYLARYEKPGIYPDKNILASGTSPKRAIAVLRNRITAMLTNQMGVV